MTASQIRTAVGGAVAVIGSVTTALTPYLALIPAGYKPTVQTVLGVLAAVGAVLAAVNQSLSQGHVSIPYDSAVQIAARMPDAPPALLAQVDKVTK